MIMPESGVELHDGAQAEEAQRLACLGARRSTNTLIVTHLLKEFRSDGESALLEGILPMQTFTTMSANNISPSKRRVLSPGVSNPAHNNKLLNEHRKSELTKITRATTFACESSNTVTGLSQFFVPSRNSQPWTTHGGCDDMTARKPTVGALKPVELYLPHIPFLGLLSAKHDSHYDILNEAL